jgi:hypothetical protein
MLHPLPQKELIGPPYYKTVIPQMWRLADFQMADPIYIGDCGFKCPPISKHILCLLTNIAYNALIQICTLKKLTKTTFRTVVQYFVKFSDLRINH